MTFEELARLLDVEGFEESPEEIHGLLCGRVAGGERLAGEEFRTAIIETVDSEPEMVDNSVAELESLYRHIIAAFGDMDLGFRPLLPPDDRPLEDRVAALAVWCECFLSGLGEAGLSDTSTLSEDALDSIKDLAAIAQAGLEGEPQEEDESDLAELQESVRVAALMRFTELCHPAPTTQATSHTVH